MLPVTRSYLPNIAKYTRYIERIYAHGQLSNNGPLVQALTERLEDYLGVENLLLVCNGSAALTLAYKALGVSGSVLTTPFTFVATSSIPAWLGIEPAYADVHPETWNLDPRSMEQGLRQNTTAVGPTHVFGNPCDDERISAIAARHDLRVIYDAAHAFGVRKNGESILKWGDASAMSFHATKVFHAVEGGGVVFRDREALERARAMTNFGMDPGTQAVTMQGTNVKLSEVHAAMGLAVLEDIDLILERRQSLVERYRARLGNALEFQTWDETVEANGAYMPVLFTDPQTCERVLEALQREKIFPRRYFYPSLNRMQPYADLGHAVRAESIAQRMLCLPLYVDLMPHDLERICDIVLATLQECRRLSVIAAQTPVCMAPVTPLDGSASREVPPLQRLKIQAA